MCEQQSMIYRYSQVNATTRQEPDKTHLVSGFLGLLAALDNAHERAHNGIVTLEHEPLIFAAGRLPCQRKPWLLLWL